MANRTRIIDEYLIKYIAKSLKDEVNYCESSKFKIASFYLPLQDPKFPPENGLYGGDSFFVEELSDGRTFIVFRNGTEHGSIGRGAIKKGNTILEEILAKKVADADIQNKIEFIDLFSQLDLLVYAWNELAIRRRGKSFKEIASSTLIVGIDKENNFEYLNLGDSHIFICRQIVLNENEKPIIGVGIASIEKILNLKKDYLSIKKYPLTSGDKIIIASDGASRNLIKNDEKYGPERLIEIIKKGLNKTPIDVIKDINADVNFFMAETALRDDYTLLVLEKNKKLFIL